MGVFDMMERTKQLFSNNRGKIIGLGVTVGAVLPNFASATEGQATAVTSALSTVAGDITSTITAIAPVALGIVGIFLTWKYGMKFFKSLSK